MKSKEKERKWESNFGSSIINRRSPWWSWWRMDFTWIDMNNQVANHPRNACQTPTPKRRTCQNPRHSGECNQKSKPYATSHKTQSKVNSQHGFQGGKKGYTNWILAVSTQLKWVQSANGKWTITWKRLSDETILFENWMTLEKQTQILNRNQRKNRMYFFHLQNPAQVELDLQFPFYNSHSAFFAIWGNWQKTKQQTPPFPYFMVCGSFSFSVSVYPHLYRNNWIR